uniref:Pseudouridylate synthase 7 homolog-like protein isoform X1 n=1 Tax=Petromyzon marinus TaxID=7757 RepID=A0AAJ7TR82_PETMA|nr:pseudouridylate synthase 7 homolog-like protein isoform X1 [Petromyzon marinus]XP_032822576.1 pseudouridylate synthase 7 homolog-like protein isoform X1 [Petromyzon marinus]XP_032822577.1 pseudouridylate synthase 7 homolog-like protein isoform X1 [Petromyzon marinus]XP_032822578.1 pseudouridylate synthase 7 homolog-like protein isoform X1 [Petromyzon marinus]XP_032822579.1 pseudouridylate synthase 7 homolog-like protein isoform X1 [Petromyzon marinus]
MEEDQEGGVDDAQQYYYIGRHPGFCGAIKQSPEDFIVVEIDEHSNRADADHLVPGDGPSSRLVPRAPDPCAPVEAKRPKLESERCINVPAEFVARCDFPAVAGPASAERPLGEGVAEEEVEAEMELEVAESTEQLLQDAKFDYADAHAALEATCEVTGVRNSVLAEDAAEALGEFAAAERAMMMLLPAGERSDAGGLSLGLFPDKETRAEVHRTVRQRFPFLKTITSGTEIKAKADPVYAEFRGLVSEEEADGFFRFVDAKRRDATFTFLADSQRARRAALHHAVTRHFGKVLETKSFSEARGGGGHCTRIVARFKGRRAPSKKRRGTDVEALGSEDLDLIDGGIYTVFTLQKTNMETLGAISMLASELGVLPSDFSYAGTKDKKAVTFQRMVVQKVTPSRLQEAAARLQARGLRVAAAKRAARPLRLGELWGNHFRVTLRGVGAPTATPQPDDAAVRDCVERSVRGVVEHGFINYYGPQRFGASQSIKTDEIGKHLLKGELDKALKLFFTPEAGDDAVNQAKRLFLETGDAKLALSLMPAHKTRERLMLRALHRCGPPRGDDVGGSGGGGGGGGGRAARAWVALPRSARLLYPQAYCSALWNRAATVRVRLLGVRRAARGDLVLPEGAGRRRDAVHVVTEEEEANEVYTIDQVVLPMPGSSVRYPDNEAGAAYRATLRRDGLADSAFRVAELRVSLPGAYRRLLARPANVSLAWTERGLPGATLLRVGRAGAADAAETAERGSLPGAAGRASCLSSSRAAQGLDLEATESARPASGDGAASDLKSESWASRSCLPAPGGGDDVRFDAEEASAGNGSGVPETSGSEETFAVGSSSSLVITFDLPSSCYATVCLGEMMKREVC